MAKDDFYINGDNIVNNKGKKVASTKSIKKNHTPIVIHKGERLIEKDQKELHRLEKKYGVKLYPRRK